MNGFPAVNGPAFTLDGHPFAGAYGSSDQEYEALTQRCALFDFSALDWLAIYGPDAVSFLQGMVTQDVTKIGEGKPALILNPSGKLVTTLYVYDGGDHLLLEVPAGSGEAVRAHLDHYLIMEDASLALCPQRSCVSVQGPTAATCLEELGPLPAGVVMRARDRCGLGGFDLIGDRDSCSQLATRLREAGVVPAGMAALNTARIEAFLPWFSQDMQAGLNPLIFGLHEYISHQKGCYVGQETVAMTRDRGRPPQVMVLLESKGEGIPQVGTALLVDSRDAGEIRSGTFSPTRQSTLAIAILKHSFARRQELNLCDPERRTWTILKSTLIPN